MGFFFVLFIVGLAILIFTRFKQMTGERATVHCIKHRWKIDEKTREMYCEECKANPE